MLTDFSARRPELWPMLALSDEEVDDEIKDPAKRKAFVRKAISVSGRG